MKITDISNDTTLEIFAGENQEIYQLHWNSKDEILTSRRVWQSRCHRT